MITVTVERGKPYRKTSNLGLKTFRLRIGEGNKPVSAHKAGQEGRIRINMSGDTDYYVMNSPGLQQTLTQYDILI